MNICAELFKSLLDSKNCTSGVDELEDGTTVITFPYDGKTALCFFAGDQGQYFSLYLTYEEIPDDKIAELIFLANELNKEYKWVKFYVDDRKNFMLQDDAILTPETAADEAFELLVRLLNIGNDIKKAVMKAIYA